MTLLPLYEVDVPIGNTAGLRGVHAFTDHADSRSAAVRIAHEVYDQARAAQQAGLEIPSERPDGWTARSYRPGWELDWRAAIAGRWNDPYSWVYVSDFQL
ncbi:hypothetical protein [Streptomyces sp. NPDC006307]|uniref:hypothetical protein n=1 Tax=Streptomyces sp. NPDC006307 TaxID=3156748 RepID=UPI0033B44E5F